MGANIQRVQIKKEPVKHIFTACGILLAMISSTIIASTTFDDKKRNILDLVEQRINILSSYKECLQEADSNEAIRHCKKKEKIAFKTMQKEINNKKIY